MSSYNPIHIDFSGYGEPNASPYEKGVSYPDFSDLIEKMRKGYGSDQPELMSAFPTLKTADMTEKPEASKQEADSSDRFSGDLASAGIKALGSAVSSVASEASKNARLRSELEQKNIANLGEQTRSALSRGSAAAHNALAHLIASFRAATR